MSAQTTGNGSVSYGQHVLQRAGGFNRKAPDFQVDAKQNHDLINLFCDDVKTFFDRYEAETRPIEHDGDLSQVGKIGRITPIREKYNREFNAGIVTRARNLRTQHIDKTAAIFRLPAEVTTGNEVQIFLQSFEIRNHLRTLALSDRIKLAFRTDDPALLHAIDTASPCLELLPAEVVRRAREYRVRARRGDQLRAAMDENLALQRVISVIQNVRAGAEWIVIDPSLPSLPDDFPEITGEDYPSEEKLNEEINNMVLSIESAVKAMSA